MALTRTDWEDLPGAARVAVEKHAGPVVSARTVPQGLNSAVAAVLTTRWGKVFVKGLRQDYPRRNTQDLEWMVAPYVAAVAPRLVWRVEEAGWDLLGFEYVDGRHADYEPGSPDLGPLLDTMTVLGRTPCPDLPIRNAAERWRPYLDSPQDAEWLQGEQLLHTDYNPLNVLMVGRRALLVDWAWPTRGAGWVDPACLILRLIAGGHTPMQAERVVSVLPAWQAAPTAGVDVFAAASVRLWEEISVRDSVSWTGRMAGAARLWLEYRRMA